LRSSFSSRKTWDERARIFHADTPIAPPQHFNIEAHFSNHGFSQ
jgi:hypothetical protein